jgi:glycerophosphoryl diester phosphodiesterase
MTTRIEPNHWLLSHPIAHRGIFDNVTIPENSLQSFQLCIQKNIAIELDVRMINDGTIVVFHDEDLERMCGRQAKVSEIDRGDLSALVLAKTAHTISTLSETLELINGQVPVLIEIKVEKRVGEIERNLAEILKNYTGEYAIQSFNPYSLQRFKRYMPEVIRGLLSGDFRDSAIAKYKKVILRKFLLNTKGEPDFINFDVRALPNRKIKRIREKGTPILCWTVKNAADLAKAQAYADNYVTEYYPDPHS